MPFKKQVCNNKLTKRQIDSMSATQRYRRFRTIVLKIKQLKEISQHQYCIVQYDPKNKKMREVYTHLQMSLINLSARIDFAQVAENQPTSL